MIGALVASGVGAGLAMFSTSALFLCQAGCLAIALATLGALVRIPRADTPDPDAVDEY